MYIFLRFCCQFFPAQNFFPAKILTDSGGLKRFREIKNLVENAIFFELGDP
jgi:hypothetical protein